MPNQLVLKTASTKEEREKIIDLLLQHELPVEDIDDKVKLYSLIEKNEVIGTAGIEIFDDCALLRSISVIKKKQGKGFGSLINDEIEKLAKQKEISCLYLLTNTAKSFFEKRGYQTVLRNEVPQVIQQTKEFASVCPSSASVMKKILS